MMCKKDNIDMNNILEKEELSIKKWLKNMEDITTR